MPFIYAHAAKAAREDPPTGRKKRARSGKVPRRYVHAMLRLSELVILAESRRQRGESVDAKAFLQVAAHAVADLTDMRQRGGVRHPGFNIDTGRQIAERLGVQMTDDSIVRIAHAVAASREGPVAFRMPMQIAGNLVELTRAERDNLDLRTMDSMDEPTAARRERKAAEKRQRDRERAKAKRAESGPKRPVHVTEDGRKPWEIEGVSRATWFRRNKRETEASPTSLYISPRRDSLKVPSPHLIAFREAVRALQRRPSLTDVARAIATHGDIIRFRPRPPKSDANPGGDRAA